MSVKILRCRFLRCGTGVQTVNFNSMDIWVWYCLFEDGDRGIYNLMGNWHTWHNLFLRSKTCDLGTQNLMAFSVVGNTSIGSRCLFDFSSGHTWGSPVSLTGNRVLDPTGDWPALVPMPGLPRRAELVSADVEWAGRRAGLTLTRVHVLFGGRQVEVAERARHHALADARRAGPQVVI